jgi:hypothetical protein
MERRAEVQCFCLLSLLNLQHECRHARVDGVVTQLYDYPKVDGSTWTALPAESLYCISLQAENIKPMEPSRPIDSLASYPSPGYAARAWNTEDP